MGSYDEQVYVDETTKGKDVCKKVGISLAFESYDGRVSKSVSQEIYIEIQESELGLSTVFKCGLAPSIVRISVIAALAGVVVAPAFSQAPEGRQQRGAGERSEGVV